MSPLRSWYYEPRTLFRLPALSRLNRAATSGARDSSLRSRMTRPTIAAKAPIIYVPDRPSEHVVKGKPLVSALPPREDDARIHTEPGASQTTPALRASGQSRHDSAEWWMGLAAAARPPARIRL
jgi:hypothetical protein